MHEQIAMYDLMHTHIYIDTFSNFRTILLLKAGGILCIRGWLTYKRSPRLEKSVINLQHIQFRTKRELKLLLILMIVYGIKRNTCKEPELPLLNSTVFLWYLYYGEAVIPFLS